MDEERNELLRQLFKSDDHFLRACKLLGKAPIYPKAVKKLIIRDRIVQMLNEGVPCKEVAKAQEVSLSHVYDVYNQWRARRKRKRNGKKE